MTSVNFAQVWGEYVAVADVKTSLMIVNHSPERCLDSQLVGDFKPVLHHCTQPVSRGKKLTGVGLENISKTLNQPRSLIIKKCNGRLNTDFRKQ
jgi:hypothetical protein